MKAVEVSNLSFTYPNGVRALNDVSFSVDKGKFLLVAGVSGSGKSTLSRLISGVEPGMGKGRVSGTIKVLDQQALKDGKLKKPKGIGLVLQNPTSQLLDLTPFECISDILLQNGNGNVEGKAKEILRAVGLEKLINSYVFSMSDGERQRLALAQVLALDPEILVLDEPLAHLDPKASREFSLLLRRMVSSGKAVIVFEHRLEFLYDLSDQIMILRQGRVVYSGNPRRAFNGLNDGLTPSPLLLARRLKLQDVFSREEIMKALEKMEVRRDTVRDDIGEEVLRLEGVEFERRGKKILDGIDLSLKRGERLALVGENGSGKTTLSLIAVGLLKPTKGKVVRRGTPMILFHPPEVQIFETSLKDMVGKEGIALLGLEERRDAHPMALSKGERLRAVLLSILRKGPEILFLDEPTVGQDIKALDSVMKFVKPLIDKGGALLFATHDLSFVAKYADRVVRLKEGRVVFDGPVEEYFASENYFPRPFIVEASLKKAGRVALRVEEIYHA